MKILITGGLGFIGHHLSARFETLGHSVVITDIKTGYGLVNPDVMQDIFEQRKKLLATDRIYTIDVADTDGIDWLIKTHQLDVVVHLASYPRQNIVNAHPQLASQTMSQGLLNLLEASAKHSVTKFVYVSSSMVYGHCENQIVNEARECHPQGPYAIMKLVGEWLVRDWSRRTGINHVIVRPSAVYGPGDLLDRVISQFFHQAMQDNTLQVNGSDQYLNFTYIDDAVNGITGACLYDQCLNKTYNVLYDQTCNLLEAAQQVIAICGAGRIQVCQQDPAYPSRGQLSVGSARRDFGFDPKINLESGLKLYHAWLTHNSTE